MPYILILLMASIAFFAIYPNADLAVSSVFFEEDKGFIYADHILAVFFYEVIYVLAYSIGTLFTLLAIIKKFALPIPLLKNLAEKLSLRQIAFIWLALAIGPGLLVHQVFKPTWERPRPVETSYFGGSKTYTAPFIITNQDSKSFISGHAAMGFYMTAFAFLFTGKRRKQLYIGGLAFGTSVSLGRIVQGKHFLSDVTFGALISLLIIHLLYKLIIERERKPSPETAAVDSD